MKLALSTLTLLLAFSFSAQANNLNNHLKDLKLVDEGCSLGLNHYGSYYCTSTWIDDADCPSDFKDSITCYKANIVDIINTPSRGKNIRTSKLKLQALVGSCDSIRNSQQSRMECYARGISLLGSRKVNSRNLDKVLLSACTVGDASGYSCLMQAMKYLQETQNVDTKLCRNMKSEHRKENCLVSLWKRSFN